MYLMFIVLAIAVAVYVWLRQPQYVAPQVAEQTDNPLYFDGKFHNALAAPTIVSQQSAISLWYRFLFGQTPDAVPDAALPTQKVDLLHLDTRENLIVWMGHSSYFIQMEGKTFLIDPVFSAYASPVPFTNTAFRGSNPYSPEDIPAIDYLLITHDHWDHLDYPSINALRSKIGHIVAPTGVGSYFRQWGFPQTQISEGGWFTALPRDGVTIHILPAQHFSGRLLTRNQTLWGSFALITDHHRLYLGGDSGYGPHFREIAQRMGHFDVAVLECGQYDENWPFIHMTPEQTAQAASDLQARALLPVHNSKFKLAHHSWYDPLEHISHAAQQVNWRLLTPRIGDTLQLDNPQQTFSAWWKTSR